MNRRDRRRARARGVASGQAQPGSHTVARSDSSRVTFRFKTSSRRVLLLSSALASSFLFTAIAAPDQALAQANCVGLDADPNIRLVPAIIGTDVSINCDNDFPRDGTGVTGNAAINLQTGGAKNSVPIFLNSEGNLESYGVNTRFGIRAVTNSSYGGSDITIENYSDIERVVSNGTAGALGKSTAYGIFAQTKNGGGTIQVTSEGLSDVEAIERATGIHGQTENDDDTIEITTTSGGITVLATAGKGDPGFAYGIYAKSDGKNSGITVTNAKDIDSEASKLAQGIEALAFGKLSDVNVTNKGDITTLASGKDANTDGIFAATYAAKSTVEVSNYADIKATTQGKGFASGISTLTYGNYSEITVTNDALLEIRANVKGSDGYGIYAYTGGKYADIEIKNESRIDVEATGDAYAIAATTYGEDSNITITHTSDIAATSAKSSATGIYAYTASGDIGVTMGSTINNVAYGPVYGINTVTNGKGGVIDIDIADGSIDVRSTSNYFGSYAIGIRAYANKVGSQVEITNGATIDSQAAYVAGGINAFAYGGYKQPSSIVIINSGDITVRAAGSPYFEYAWGIAATTYGKAGVTITNKANIEVTSSGSAYGIVSYTFGNGSYISVTHSADIDVTSTYNGVYAGATGIGAATYGINSEVNIDVGSSIAASGSLAFGIYAYTRNGYSPISITTSSTTEIDVEGAGVAYGIEAITYGGKAANTDSPIDITSGGTITTRASAVDGFATGIAARTYGDNSGITINNAAKIDAIAPNGETEGIYAETQGSNSKISINNTGDITSTGGTFADAIDAETEGDGSSISIFNSGRLRATGGTGSSTGVEASTEGANSDTTIENSGSVFAAGAESIGIRSTSDLANKTTIINAGDVSAESHLAIEVEGAGTADIFNTGLITGFVDLTEQDDLFENQAGGVFETKKTSLFGGGNDLFVNESGGTVLAATNASTSESSAFEGLERFENAGLISMQDGRQGDSFTISNTPGGEDLEFVGQSGSTLAVDTFLGGPGSTSDTFTIEGDVSGTTWVNVNNTNAGPGTFNSQGIPVVFVTGDTPSAGNFQLQDGPIDTGLFDYDLFFEPTGSGQWEFRSFAGATAQALPKLLTAAQDLWHQSSATWFDRTADLRVVLARGGPPAFDDGSKSLVDAGPNGLTPGVWMKGGGGRLDRDGSATTSAYGRTYNYDLDNEFSSFDLQVGVDMGQYDVISQGDVLIFGVLGGFVGGKLDYDSLADTFDFSGGQVGAYATYLNGGL
ncbi:MAG: hypothetical protein AAGF48_12400, partial [Pseudomonadota bacterium]